MSLVTLDGVLKEATEKRYAVGSFNVANYDMAEAVLNSAEKTGTPVIINIAEMHLRYLNIDDFVEYLLLRIERSPLPIVLHFDHGMSFESCSLAVSKGFSSVMIDASMLPYEQNVEITGRVAEYAHRFGVSVEGELGHVGGGEGDLREGSEVNREAFTDPSMAVEFVSKTQLDALAIAVGTVHGPYRGTPELDFDRIARIRSLLKTPLVLHGGSGLSDRDFQTAIEKGISKVNFYTQTSLEAVREVKMLLDSGEPVSYPDLTRLAVRKMEEAIVRQIGVFGTKSCR